MIVTVLGQLGADPGFVNGGVVETLGTSSGTGADEVFVLEGDESDGSFMLYDTAIALITNVDADHLDHYGSQERVRGRLRGVRLAGARVRRRRRRRAAGPRAGRAC